MIYVNITGGVGNQLFQYAFSRKVQKETNQEILLNTFELKKYDYKRQFELDKFCLNDFVESSEVRMPWFVHRRSLAGKIIRHISNDLMFKIGLLHNSYIWYGDAIKKLPRLDADKDIYIGGYWQAGSYSEEITAELKQDFLLQPQYRKGLEKWEDKIFRSKESVCLHIRRGDYVGTPYEVCTIDYYNAGIKYIENHLSHPEIFVFSDDIGWAKENIHFNGKTYYIDDRHTAYQDLYLMSLCKHFIISNSTFSWWAQHLGSSNKLVVAPSKWHRILENSALYEKSWILISEKGELI